MSCFASCSNTLVRAHPCALVLHGGTELSDLKLLYNLAI